MLGAFLQAHRHVSVLALQECCEATAIADLALPDHSGVSHGGLALFWRRAQFQLVEFGYSAAKTRPGFGIVFQLIQPAHPISNPT